MIRLVFNGTSEAKDILRDAMKSGSKFLVYFDPDADGLISGYLICRFLSAYGKSYDYYINENRQHGFFLDSQKLAGYTIIAVDFSLGNEYEKLKEIVDAGANIINIDHHSISSDALITYSNGKTRGVIINNQYSFEPDDYRFYSGAGVVWEVLSAIKADFDCEEVQALVGISLLTDIREIENDKAKDLLEITYSAHTPLINYLLYMTTNSKDFQFGYPAMDRNYIDYTFSPKINALFRLNRGDLAVKLILEQLGEQKIDFDSFKRVQNENIALICEKAKKFDLPNIACFGVYKSDLPNPREYEMSNFIGVACSRLKNDVGKTTFVFLLTDDAVIERGSVRGKYDIDYLTLFSEANLQCKGHKNAFGVRGAGLQSLDIASLQARVQHAESSRVKKNRVQDITNLALWGRLQNRKVAKANLFLRDCNRLYLYYKGDMENVITEKHGKMILYKIDNIPVKCFDATITPKNGVILPILERGYVIYYLKKIEER